MLLDWFFRATPRNFDDIVRLRAVQHRRLTELVSFARARSPFYRQLYQSAPEGEVDLAFLPPVTKPQLMAAFDVWATDRRVSRASVDAFIRDKQRVGRSYLGKYSVWTTSGTTGEPGIFLQNAAAQGIYNSMYIWRGFGSWLTWQQLGAMMRRGFHCGLILAVGDHYAGAANWARVQRQLGPFADRLRIFPILEPLPRLVAALNAYQPAILISYPSVLALLAGEQSAGRLNLHPVILNSLGEGLDDAARQHIEAAFPAARLVDIYAATECLFMGFECEYHWQHANNDWSLLEPVDEANQPVAAGQPSANVLVTNFANRIQPIIRYQLGDSLTFKPDPCECGNPLPAFHIAGRTDELLTFGSLDGGSAQVLPMAIASVVEQVAGVIRYQIIQTGTDQLNIRLEVDGAADLPAVRGQVETNLQQFFYDQALTPVIIRMTDERPQVNPVSGKMRHVFCEEKTDRTLNS